MLENEDKILLFGPKSGKSLLRLYPELSNEPDFKELSQEDLNFAWYVGNPSSPIDQEWEDQVKLRTAAATCFKNNELKRREYSSGQIPEHVKRAIERMKTYSPDARMLAKKMVQDTFERYQKLLNVNVEKDFLVTKKIGKGDSAEEITEMDWTGRKSYVDSASKIIAELPLMIKQLEEGFGITQSKKGKEEQLGKRAIDRYHQQSKE
jgi:hypothetical protein